MFSNSKHTGFLPQGPAAPLHKTCLSGLMPSNRADATSALPFDYLTFLPSPFREADRFCSSWSSKGEARAWLFSPPKLVCRKANSEVVAGSGWWNVTASRSYPEAQCLPCQFSLVAFLSAWKDVRTGFDPKGSRFLYPWCTWLYVQNLNWRLSSFPPNSDILSKLSTWTLA